MPHTFETRSREPRRRGSGIKGNGSSRSRRGARVMRSGVVEFYGISLPHEKKRRVRAVVRGTNLQRTRVRNVSVQSRVYRMFAVPSTAPLTFRSYIVSVHGSFHLFIFLPFLDRSSCDTVIRRDKDKGRSEGREVLESRSVSPGNVERITCVDTYRRRRRLSSSCRRRARPGSTGS